MRIEVRFFAIARDLAATAQDALQLPSGATVQDAADELARRFPNLAPSLARVRFAVNQNYVDRTSVLVDRDELAVIPPVSGG
jgi:molybdopterin converting factor subunit 1